MIEKTVLDYLSQELSVPAWMEIPEGETLPDKYVLLEKTGSSEADHVCRATVAIQAYAESMHEAAVLNESVKEAMKGIVALPQVGKVRLNSDYNFTDTREKKYRYQAVFDLVHY